MLKIVQSVLSSWNYFPEKYAKFKDKNIEYHPFFSHFILAGNPHLLKAILLLSPNKHNHLDQIN